MYEFVKIWLALKFDRRAVTSLEYGLIAAIVILVGLFNLAGVGTSLGSKITKVKNAMS